MVPAWAACCCGLLAVLSAGAAPVINEIMYRPGTTYPENTGLEFIEIHNPDTAAVDLSGWAITTAADYVFPAGTTLAAGGYVVVASNPTALKAATGLATVYGPWKTGATLSNRGEDVTLSKPGSTAGTWETVDVVTYASEGDWSTRTRDSLGGWSWTTGAHDGGKSLERRNPRLARDSGQNWGSSTPVGGTPGAVNSLYASNVAPLITQVKHAPAVPRSTDPVTISCRLDDESSAAALSATLYWRNATGTTAGAFQSVAMSNPGNGSFAATLPAMADKTIVEFYVSASDGVYTRTWPAPTSEGQNANAAYQVDNEVVAGVSPVYRLIMTGAENAAYNSLSTSNPRSDRQFAFTLVVMRGADATIRYRSSLRFRGNSSRSYTIKPLRISMPTDDRWDGISDFTIGPRGAPWQYLAHKIQRAAGLVAADVSPVEVRRNGVEYAVTTGSTADYGKLVRVEEIDGDYVDNHWPDAVSGQIYRKTAVTSWASTGAAPSDPEGIWSGWSKQNNSAANDWSDVMRFSSVWQAACAPHFTGATAGNVAAGNWDGTGFTDAEMAQLATVADLDYMARWLAIMTVIPNGEPNLSTGEDDDYAAAFINDGTNTRMVLVPHDMDTTFGSGEQTVASNFGGLYNATEVDTGGGMGGVTTQMKPLLPLMGNTTTPGNAAFRAKYLTAIRELFGSLFDADTSGGNTNPSFYQFVDAHLSDWVPAANRTTVKNFMTARQSYLLGLIGAGKIAPTTATSTGTRAAAATPSLRLNEVLASNTKSFVVATTYPDVIELYNAGTAAVDLAGKSLTDDPATPRKYTFPAGTTLAAGAYLAVYADSNTTLAGLHTGFGLDAEGDAVYLYDTAASGGALLDSLVFGFQLPDYSLARTAADPTVWALAVPTVGAANGAPVTLGTFTSVKINEWAGSMKVRVAEDFLELYNASASPVALGGARLTDDVLYRSSRYVFPALSFMAPGSLLVMDSDRLGFGLDGDFDTLFLIGENGAVADRVDFSAQAEDHSTGRTTDGAITWSDFAVPTPGLSNATALPASYSALLAGLRITEVMYKPVAASSAGDYEYVELKNIGSTTLDLSGVRFTQGIDYTFAAGATLAPGAYVVVCKSRTAFLSRYPNAAAALAAGNFSGALDNSGEDIALTLPSPWNVNILYFAYDPAWQPLTANNGYSLVALAPATMQPRDYDDGAWWIASSQVDGSPGSDGALAVAGAGSAGGVAGQPTTLSVVSSVSSGATYQWQFLVNGQWVNLTGATGATYTLASTQLSQNGSYRVVVTTNGVSTASEAVVVSVATPASASTSRVVNLSTRGLTQAGANTMIPGFVITGTGTQRVLVRAVGPTLTTFGVSGALADPQFTLKRLDSSGAYVDVVSNNNWGSSGAATTATLAATFLATGAFSLPETSTDAAVVMDLAPGQYTALVTGAGTESGVALAEVYDAGGSAGSTRLVNLATRGRVATGADVLIAGFVITGTEPLTLLLRGVGPGLSAYGVTDPLSDPQIVLYGRLNGATTDQVLATSDNWSSEAGAASTTSVGNQVGAFALTSGSKDAAMVVTLPPGGYTLHTSGVGNGSGVALVEIYVVR